jgi:acetoin utilization deacetylase AcuC-like enzyme
MCAFPSRVAYFYDHDVGDFYYALGHPMKPHRMRMVHELLIAYGVHERLQVLQPPRATERDLTRFHSDDYIEFLKRITPETAQGQMDQLQRCKFPFFDFKARKWGLPLMMTRRLPLPSAPGMDMSTANSGIGAHCPATLRQWALRHF